MDICVFLMNVVSRDLCSGIRIRDYRDMLQTVCFASVDNKRLQTLIPQQYSLTLGRKKNLPCRVVQLCELQSLHIGCNSQS